MNSWIRNHRQACDYLAHAVAKQEEKVRFEFKKLEDLKAKLEHNKKALEGQEVNKNG